MLPLLKAYQVLGIATDLKGEDEAETADEAETQRMKPRLTTKVAEY